MTNQRKNLLLLSTTATGGKTTTALGIMKLLSDAGRQVAYFKPVAQRIVYTSDQPRDRDKVVSESVMNELIKRGYVVTESLAMDEARRYFATGRGDYFAERVVELYQQHIAADVDLVIVEGMQYDDAAATLAFEVNTKLAHSLTADVVLIVDASDRVRDAVAGVRSFINAYREEGVRISGIILNKVKTDDEGNPAVPEPIGEMLEAEKLALLGVVPFVAKLSAPRIRDLVEPLQAKVLRGTEESLMRRAMRPMVMAMQAGNAIKHFKDGDLVITPGDRDDIIMLSFLYERALDTHNIAGIILTAGYAPSEAIMELLDQQGGDSLPILLVDHDTFTTTSLIKDKRVYIEDDDWEKIRWSVQLIADNLQGDQLLSYLNIPKPDLISPAMFRFTLMDKAKAAQKTVVLPEGNEPRTLQAASIILERGITKLVLLGNREEIIREAKNVRADISKATIIDPTDSPLFDSFVDEYVELRKHKGMNRTTAADLMQDTVFFGTMMVYRGMVDGLVSGAVHTTQHTILPAFQIIKTVPGVELVSSIFFMLLDDRVWVFGDCAVVPEPTAPQLAQIAVQSWQSAIAFGMNPKVAMISYSTGTSGVGEEVDKVREATALAKSLAPDMVVDGPLQFDAASVPDVAAKKAPNSPVAGQANVFIFPDLNTGNTTYKAVQRSGDYISIGPMLQGLKRPVNDLSRGALVDDIVYTIAITAIQSSQN
jgi:phosphate acetyltransferase